VSSPLEKFKILTSQVSKYEGKCSGQLKPPSRLYVAHLSGKSVHIAFMRCPTNNSPVEMSTPIMMPYNESLKAQ
jgi:hypothetical protein